MIVIRWWQAGYPTLGGVFLDMPFYKQTLPLTPAELQAYVRRFPKEHTTMATWSEQLIEKGRQQGLQLAFQEAFQLGYEEGYQIGRRQAFLELLPLMLERYFGAVDEETQERIRNASTDELRRWILNSRYAGRLEDVFRLQ